MKLSFTRNTTVALAADWFDDVIKILPTVVVSNFFAGFNVPLRPDPHSAVLNDCFGIGAT